MIIRRPATCSLISWSFSSAKKNTKRSNTSLTNCSHLPLRVSLQMPPFFERAYFWARRCCWNEAVADARMKIVDAAVYWSQNVLSKLADSSDKTLEVQAYMVLAMAEHQLQHQTEACAALAKGLDIERTKMPKLESGNIETGRMGWI